MKLPRRPVVGLRAGRAVTRPGRPRTPAGSPRGARASAGPTTTRTQKLRLRRRLRRSKVAAEVTVKRKTAFTSRAAILAVVLAALAIALAAPVRQLLSQHAQIASLRTSVEAQKQRIADLQKQQALWADPAYVAAQAADRLHYVRPGQIPFVTLSPKPSADQSVSSGAAITDQPWYGQLWSSVQAAGARPGRSAEANASTASPAPVATLRPGP